VVALLVRLKLTLLRNSLRRSVWRTVGLIVGLVYGLGAVAGVLAGLVALRWASKTLTADVTVLAFSSLTIGWVLMSLLVFGVDETVDPARFALLPVRAGELLPGLLVTALIGVPGLATVLIGLGLVITWARSLPLLLAALLAVPPGVVTCVLLARVATAAFAAVLSSRRFRDLAVVGFLLLTVVLALASNLLGRFAETGRTGIGPGPAQHRHRLGRPAAGTPLAGGAVRGVGAGRLTSWRGRRARRTGLNSAPGRRIRLTRDDPGRPPGCGNPCSTPPARPRTPAR